MKKTIQATAWCNHELNLEDAYNANDKSSLPFSFSESDMSEYGWIRIGTATIHLDLIDPKDTVAAQVESLQAQITKTMADSEATITILRSRINDLLAIENTQVQP